MSNKYGSLAIISCLCGLCFAGLVLGPIAMILGKIGMKKDDSPKTAKIGFWGGLIEFILCLAFYIIIIILTIIFYG